MCSAWGPALASRSPSLGILDVSTIDIANMWSSDDVHSAAICHRSALATVIRRAGLATGMGGVGAPLPGKLARWRGVGWLVAAAWAAAAGRSSGGGRPKGLVATCSGGLTGIGGSSLLPTLLTVLNAASATVVVVVQGPACPPPPLPTNLLRKSVGGRRTDDSGVARLLPPRGLCSM